ncbi:SpdA protein, partial [Streptomyces sp. MI02-2A]
RTGRDRSSWTWFAIALCASLGANVATAGLLDMEHVPAWLRILVAGWPALAFLGGTLLVHAPAPNTTDPEPEPAAQEVEMHRTDTPEPAPAPLPAAELTAASPPPATAPTVPPALLDHARSIADAHRNTTGEPITADVLTARLGLPASTCQAIAAQLQLT